jgi:hypothetical protein
LDIIALEIVEILSNLVWVAVAAALLAVWLTGRWRGRAESLLPAIGMQLVALAVLVVILLPVISVTDDLQANTNPAETERMARRGDAQPAPDQPLQHVPVALAVLASAPRLPRMQAWGFIARQHLAAESFRGFFRDLPARSPPA